MDKSLLITIFVPTTDETGKDFGGKHGERATGYPVGKDLILTARRILEPESPYYRPEFGSTFIHYTKVISISSMVRNMFSCFLLAQSDVKP